MQTNSFPLTNIRALRRIVNSSRLRLETAISDAVSNIAGPDMAIIGLRICFWLIFLVSLAMAAVAFPYLRNETANISAIILRYLDSLNISQSNYVNLLVGREIVVLLISFAIPLLLYFLSGQSRIGLIFACQIMSNSVPRTQLDDAILDTNPTGLLFALFALGDGLSTLFSFWGLYVFPDGVLRPRHLRFVFILFGLWIPFWLVPATHPGNAFGSIEDLIYLALFVIGLASQVYRYRRVLNLEQRQQVKLVMIAFGILFVARVGLVGLVPVLIPALHGPSLERFVYDFIAITIYQISLILVYLSELVSILRYRLWEINFFIRRITLLGIILLLGFVFWFLQPQSCPPDCVGATLVVRDLRQANLSGGNFVEANLYGADLSEANLRSADLSGASMRQASLKEANLREANLIGADLREANLIDATLTTADLRGANLGQVNLTRVDLTQIKLTGVRLTQATLVGSDLNGINLDGVDLFAADLRGAVLHSARLKGAILSTADLSGADIRDGQLNGAWLNRADLSGTNLQGADLSGAVLIGSDLTSANLSDATFIGANLIGANLNGANLRGADLTGARVTVSQLQDGELMRYPVINILNQLDRNRVIRDADLRGVLFNQRTKWPNDRFTPPVSLVR
ncbi:MAG: pentapeptide repeat-containing protein [Chloroflexota bacterium]